MTETPPPLRLLLLADYVHPFVYREGFPQGVPNVDVVLVAGDVPGYYLEFIATKLPVPVLYVPGNHANEYVNEGDGRREPRGVTNVHGRVVTAAGLRVAGWGGVPKYREKGDGQYTDWQARWGLGVLGVRAGRAPIDVLLTHAPPLGPHAGSDHAHRGCPHITAFVRARRPRLVVHGHIHEYEGKKLEYTDEASGARVVNAYGYRVLELPARAADAQSAP
ncbi:metallophosphoesterase family protein [Deinococcus maricopensis]|uniref:Metallophosphoesterase n=1 Tax=Deinococcus maricopensis (strain DSM 21211 / LMG 22137 / NRRL B-23946 / LB-34) TaxID=709986 RepID=E8UC19_DEIML|nr:metallophosphoesterase [Deinococcus maricopensis]ADV68680.1 metallophosphoesterase [Deinococcus maricopensis DSM 21211]